MARIVVADTPPLRYLVVTELTHLLPAIYGEVIIPESVARERSHASAPQPVRQWIASPPMWLRAFPAPSDAGSLSMPHLDAGERDAILIALHIKADLLLMDERDGVDEARQLGLSVTGTPGVLDLAAERGLIELAPAIARLRQTNVRADPALLDRMIAADLKRRSQ